MKWYSIYIIAILVFISNLLTAQDKIYKSYNYLPFGNGMGVGIYKTLGDTKLSHFYNHIYKQYNENTTTENYIKNGFFWGVNEEWLSGMKVTDAKYINGTGIIEIKKENEKFTFIENYFMPFGETKNIVVSILTIKNRRNSSTEINPYFFIDSAMGDSGSVYNENITKEDNIFIEKSPLNKEKMNLISLFENIESFSYVEREKLPENIKKETFIPKNEINYTGNDLVGIIKLKKTKLAPVEEKKYLAIFGFCNEDEKKGYISQIKKMMSNKKNLLNDEKKDWDSWHKEGNEKEYLSCTKKETGELLMQSMATLKMGQSIESGKAYGQIVASLPPGEWSITWPRDAAYSIVAFAKSGHFKEAKAGLEFMLNAPNGTFNSSNYIGMDYKISVCRYYGNGDEWSDYNAQGPNVEYDDFGLFLWAYAEYIKASSDTEFDKKYGKIVKELVADVLVELSKENGFLSEDSSIWERHWEPQNHPDGKKHFTYSTINAFNGLAKLAEIATNEEDKKYLKEAADKIKSVFTDTFTKDGIVVQSIEDGVKGLVGAIDASVVEAINFDLVDKEIGMKTLESFDNYLKMKNNSPGYKRNDDGGWYDNQEWVMVDMRIASANIKYGNKEKSKELIDWITNNAQANYNLIPELLDEKKSKFTGAIPMCGFGAGVYSIAVMDYITAFEKCVVKANTN